MKDNEQETKTGWGDTLFGMLAGLGLALFGVAAFVSALSSLTPK